MVVVYGMQQDRGWGGGELKYNNTIKQYWEGETITQIEHRREWEKRFPSLFWPDLKSKWVVF